MRKLALLSWFSLSACTAFAINLAPKKQANPVQSAESKAANDAFWEILHGGRYAAIPELIERLERVYLADPTDAVTTAHLGFLHIWALAERTRLDPIPATVTDHMLLSQRYFAEAVEMTGDARFLGFLAVTELTNGTIHKDERLVRTGYFRMKDAVAQYPEFNLFTRGYSGSMVAIDHERFKQGVEDMWANLDFCFGQKLPRDNPDYTPVMAQETQVGVKRVCWNGWIAPHNHEGFALNFGDMLVKAGDTAAARRMYENAKLSKTYARWPYRAVLDQRLEQLDENVALFRKPAEEVPVDRRMMFSSSFNCTGCHADQAP